MDALAEDIAKVHEHVRQTIGEDPAKWFKWPGGWPGDIESALIDAVFSARAIYRSKRGRGISRKIADWQAGRTRSAFSLPTLYLSSPPGRPTVSTPEVPDLRACRCPP